jgi:two-component system, OmpR family, KDP operon response regulator KdpE
MDAGKLTVLVIDDDEAICGFVTGALEDEGYRVVCATGSAALRLAEEAHPDVILLDVGMPRLDGVKLSQLLRAHPRMARTPIVIMSGLEQERAPIALHYDAWLRKPFELTALSAIVATMAA